MIKMKAGRLMWMFSGFLVRLANRNSFPPPPSSQQALSCLPLSAATSGRPEPAEEARK